MLYRILSIDKDNNTISVSIKYQNGVSDVAVYICNPDECKSGTYNKYQRIYSDQLTAYKKSAGDIESINSTESTVTEVFKFDNGSMVSGTKSLNAYSDKITSDGKVNNEYKIIVYAKYCVVRNKDKTDCSKYDSDESQLRLNETFILKGGLTNYGDLNTTIGNILTIINNIVPKTVLPPIAAIWLNT